MSRSHFVGITTGSAVGESGHWRVGTAMSRWRLGGGLRRIPDHTASLADGH